MYGKVGNNLYIGRNHDGVIARSGIVSHHPWEEKPRPHLPDGQSCEFLATIDMIYFLSSSWPIGLNTTNFSLYKCKDLLVQSLARWTSMQEIPGSIPAQVITYLIFGEIF